MVSLSNPFIIIIIIIIIITLHIIIIIIIKNSSHYYYYYRWQNYKNTGRCNGSYHDTRSQNYKLSLQFSVKDDIKFVKNVIQR